MVGFWSNHIDSPATDSEPVFRSQAVIRKLYIMVCNLEVLQARFVVTEIRAIRKPSPPLGD
jgi:hypothetical protein